MLKAESSLCDLKGGSLWSQRSNLVDSINRELLRSFEFLNRKFVRRYIATSRLLVVRCLLQN